MAGLRRLCKMYGGMVINGTHYSWDYHKDEPVLKSKMPLGSARWRRSENARAQKIKAAMEKEKATP